MDFSIFLSLTNRTTHHDENPKFQFESKMILKFKVNWTRMSSFSNILRRTKAGVIECEFCDEWKKVGTVWKTNKLDKGWRKNNESISFLLFFGFTEMFE